MATALSEGDMTQTIGPAGWLGVCLVVVAVVLLIIAAPNKLPPSPGQESRPAAALPGPPVPDREGRSEEHTSELQSRLHLVCRLLLEKKKKKIDNDMHDQRDTARV